ncbi:unnamed protein product [Enterobius vermicularis]|uniref:Uncharacterized protein n=1 Tax=Enterobius vermicularis TaxID=51028 RepID=A0A3P6J1H6_ENTVE|nr:unnamed protein product [Enterobius vermicularis]
MLHFAALLISSILYPNNFRSAADSCTGSNRGSNQSNHGVDVADAVKGSVGIQKELSYVNDYGYVQGKVGSSYRTGEKIEFVENKKKEGCVNDWSPKGSKSDPSSCKGKVEASLPSANNEPDGAEVISPQPETSYCPYEGELLGNSTVVGTMVLHETNPFVDLNTRCSEESSSAFPTFPVQRADYFCPSSTSAQGVLSSSLQSPYAHRKGSFASNATYGRSQAYNTHCLDSHQTETNFEKFCNPLKTNKRVEAQSPTSSRNRLSSAGSSHSSDDSPQIEESGDRKLLKDARTKSHGGSSSSRRKKLSHMEQFAANRALYGENLPAADASKSAKHSPSLKKHSRKHSTQSGFKKNSAGQLDSSSFVNTSFQAEDWESRPLSPTKRALPQHS